MYFLDYVAWKTSAQLFGIQPLPVYTDFEIAYPFDLSSELRFWRNISARNVM